ncbi:restriction endonuclease subunit S, partial [Leptospira borgpetersenii serovar Ballum]|nr:restriction endonuclease subunit S [Leptospira borgpetersenii serovar Ballum]
ANIAVGRIRWDDVVYWPSQEGLEQFSMRSGDIVLGMDRPWIADGLRIAQLSNDDTPCLLLQRVAALRANDALRPDHLIKLLMSEAFYHHCAPEMTGVSVPHISPAQVGDFVIAMPPPAEQREIELAVRTKTDQITALVAEAEAAIVLLQERRAALISAAVTGKIDVRGIVP